MANKDPAFLFYSSDFITGVQVMSMEDRGRYITILCLMHQQGHLSEETIRFLVGSVSDTLKSKFLIDENGHWYNKRLEAEAEKRRKFAESRYQNGIKGGRPKKEEKPLGLASGNLVANHMPNLPEDENIISIIRQLESINGSIPPLKIDYFMYLVVEMVKLFIDSNPEYFFDKETDYSACLEIAYKIATMKSWKKDEVVNGRLKECLTSWKTIVEFIKEDEWFKTRSLSDMATVKEWQRLVQKMNNAKTPKDTKSKNSFV